MFPSFVFLSLLLFVFQLFLNLKYIERILCGYYGDNIGMLLGYYEDIMGNGDIIGIVRG